MQVLVDVSLGELIDKLTILQIKAERIQDKAKLKNIIKERDVLQTVLQKLALPTNKIEASSVELKAINEKLWDIEDNIRQQEASKAFAAEFITLARAVYITNDQHAAIKKQINLQFGSDLVEEKSYQNY